LSESERSIWVLKRGVGTRRGRVKIAPTVN